MNPIISFFSFIINDFKADFIFLRSFFKGELKPSENPWWKRWNLGEILKAGWLWYLLLALAFVIGWYRASQYYQDLANSFILENCVQLVKTWVEQPLNHTIDIGNLFK